LLLLALCGPLLWFLKGGTAKKKASKRHMADNDQDEARLLESESTAGSGSQFVSYDAGQSQYIQNQDFSRCSTNFGGASSTASIASSSPLLGTFTPPRVVASLTPPKLVGWVDKRQRVSPSSSFVMEGASASMSAGGTVNGASVSVAPSLVPAGMLQVGEQQMVETINVPMQQMVETINVPMQQMVGTATPPAPLMPMGMMFR